VIFPRTVLVLVPLVATACSSDPPSQGDGGTVLPESSCPTGFLGDPNEEPQVELISVRADGTAAPLTEGADLSVILPPQGGRVAFIGVRATNLDGCGVQLFGALRDLASKRIQVDGRTINLNKTSDGWGTSGSVTTDLTDVGQISNFSNVPLCPNQWADTDVFDQPFEVEVTVTDRRKKKKTVTMKVVPRCNEPGKEQGCRCLCKKGYTLGESCGLDGGVDGAL
jgi:hypothetical protein